MSDVEVLRLVALPGVLLSLAAMWFTVWPIARANGSRPILWVIVFVAALNGLWAFAAADIAFRLDEIDSTGRTYAWVFYARIFPSAVACALIWLGWWMRRKQHD